MAANYADQVRGIRADVVRSFAPSPAKTAALNALDIVATRLETLAAEERTAVETLAGSALSTLTPEEAAVWVELMRARRAAGR